MSAETDGDRSLNISDSGDAENLFSFENTHRISSMNISTDDKSSEEYMTLYINFVELQNSGINVSNVGVNESRISNAEITEVNRQKADEEIVLAIQIKHQNISNSVQIESIQLDNINTSEGKMSDDIQYRVGAVNNNSTDSYNELETNGYIKSRQSLILLMALLKSKIKQQFLQILLEIVGPRRE